MYLICAEKQRIAFFDPPVSGLFHPDRIRFCESLSPLKPVFYEVASADLLELFGHVFNVVGIGSISPTNKI